jgi:uncharacterized coiled-coil DUF342 family protein
MDQLRNVKDHPLLPYLRRFRARLRLRDGLLFAQRSLWIAGLVSVLILLAGRIWPVANLRWWALIPLAAWLLASVGYALFYRLPPLKVALRVDNELHLKERLSTSLAVDGGGSKSVEAVIASFAPELVDRMHTDALSAARGIIPTRDFPLRTERRPLLSAGVALLIALVLVFLPNQMDAVLREREAVRQAVDRQAENIEQLREEVAEAEEMTPEEREELLKRLAELAEKLRTNRGDLEQALADISQLEAQLRERLDPKGGQKAAMLEALAAQMQALAQQEATDPGDMQAAAEALEQLAEQMEEMTSEEQAALAQQLAQMAARAAQAGDSQLAQALSAMAQAAQSGDPSAAQQAAQNAGEALEAAEGRLANQQALGQTVSQLQDSRQSVSRAGQQGQQQANQNGQQDQNGQQGQNGQPGQNGQNGQPGQSGQQGQQGGQSGQPGQGQGQPGGGGGTTANTLPGDTRSGQAGDPQGQRDPGSEGQLDGQVYVPREKRPQGEGEIFIPGQDTGEGETQSREQPDPLGGVNNPALIPYQAVFETYLDAANQAMEQSYIPPGLEEYIRRYFSELEP